MKFDKIKNNEDYLRLVNSVRELGFEKCLEKQLNEAGQSFATPVEFFFRDDDIDLLTPNLLILTRLFIEQKIPLHLQIIPESLTENTVRYLLNLKWEYPGLLHLNQHGWSHVNHCLQGRKHEFGENLSLVEQTQDIARGYDLLRDKFQTAFSPIFTPPWNRYNHDTLLSLKELGFMAISADGGHIGPNASGLMEISTAVDTHHLRPNPELKIPAHLLFEIGSTLQDKSVVGILLHHKEMVASDFKFLTTFLSMLRSHHDVLFPTFEELCSRFAIQQFA